MKLQNRVQRCSARLSSVSAALALLGAGAHSATLADATYSISDGVAEIALSIDPGETMVWMNTFPVDPAGVYIDSVKVAFGRVGSNSPINNLPVTILLYEDENGGSPKDAVLKWSFQTTVKNGNTNVLNSYDVPSVAIRGTLVAGAMYRNTTPIPIYMGALDTTSPTLSARSWYGWAVSLDPANLGAIPSPQWGPIEQTGTAGNHRIEAHGRSVPGPGAVQLGVQGVPLLGVVRLSWTGGQLAYDIERASRPDFLDGQVIASRVPGPTYDDPALDDSQDWFYRIW